MKIFTVRRRELEWLAENKIVYDIIEYVVDPHSFFSVPYRIRINDEKDYAWFVLRWS